MFEVTELIDFCDPFQSTIPTAGACSQSTLWSSEISTHRMWSPVAWCEHVGKEPPASPTSKQGDLQEKCQKKNK